MNTYLGYFAFTPSVIVGFLFVHLMWPSRNWAALLLKLSLGIGLGLGINSILLFLTLLIKVIRYYVVGFLLIAMMILLQMIFRKKQEKPLYRIEYSKLTLFQKILFSVAIISFALSLISFTKIYKNRPEGAFDAWSI